MLSLTSLHCFQIWLSTNNEKQLSEIRTLETGLKQQTLHFIEAVAAAQREISTPLEFDHWGGGKEFGLGEAGIGDEKIEN